MMRLALLYATRLTISKIGTTIPECWGFEKVTVTAL